MKASVAIIGLGYLGHPLGEDLHRLGYLVLGTTRTEAKLQSLRASGIKTEVLSQGQAPSTEILKSDAIVLNIPPFGGQLEWFQSWPWDPTRKIIFVSSTSVYAHAEGLVDETSALVDGILSREEDWVRKTFPRHAILRAGGILGPGRHPGKILSGRKGISKPLHPVNLIHVEDLMEVIKSFIISTEIGIYNVVSDERHTRKEFYQDFCRRNHLPLPEFNEDDYSSGKIVSNGKLKSFYELTWPTIFGRDP